MASSFKKEGLTQVRVVVVVVQTPTMIQSCTTYSIYSICAAPQIVPYCSTSYSKGFIFISGNIFNYTAPSNDTVPYLL